MPDVPPLVPPDATFAFGESPFRVKGVLYQGTQTFFERSVPGGLTKLTDMMGPGQLADFISQKFLSGSWYDVMPVPALIAHEARALDQSLKDYLLHRTRWQADRDIKGVYKFLLRLVSPEFVVERLPKVLTQMFEFPSIEVDAAGERERVARMLGIPTPLREWLRTAIAVYTERTLSLAGATTVDVEFLAPVIEDRRAGITLETLGYRVRWTNE